MTGPGRVDLDEISDRLGRRVEFISAPGGHDRKTVLCRVDGRTAVLSKRGSESRARMEAEILRRLAPFGVAPKCLLQSGDVLVQEVVEGQRLPVALYQADPGRRGALIRSGVAALMTAQAAGRETGLAGLVPRIGARPGWTRDLAASATRLGRVLDVDVPDHDFGDWLDIPGTEEAEFIKWDARPGNIMVRPDGSACLIDWEHAGRRRPVDDFAWFFADEWMPDAPEIVQGALSRLAASRGANPDVERRRFLAMAVAHSCIRLQLIHARKGTGGWWDLRSCLQKDRVGVTPGQVRLVSARAARWAGEVAELQPLASFFSGLPDRFGA